MTQATDLETKEAVERFARLSEAEQDAVTAEGRIQSIEDLKGLSVADKSHFGPIIEEQTPTT